MEAAAGKLVVGADGQARFVLLPPNPGAGLSRSVVSDRPGTVSVADQKKFVERVGPRPVAATTAGVTVDALKHMHQQAVVEAERSMRAEADRFPWETPPDSIAWERCVAEQRALADLLFPHGIASTATLDGRALATEPSTRRLLGRPDDRTAIPDWDTLLEHFETLGIGGVAFVTEASPGFGLTGHAYTLINTTKGLYKVDSTTGEGVSEVDPAAVKGRLLFQGSALLVASTGQARTDLRSKTPAPKDGIGWGAHPTSTHIGAHPNTDQPDTDSDSDDAVSVADSAISIYHHPADPQPASSTDPIWRVLYTGSYTDAADRFERAVAKALASPARAIEGARAAANALWTWLEEHREKLGPATSDDDIAAAFFETRPSQPAQDLFELLGDDSMWDFRATMDAFDRAVRRYAAVLSWVMDVPYPEPFGRHFGWVEEMRDRGYLVSDMRPDNIAFLFQVGDKLLPDGNERFVGKLITSWALGSWSLYDTALAESWAINLEGMLGAQASDLYDQYGEYLAWYIKDNGVVLDDDLGLKADLVPPHLQWYGELAGAPLPDEEVTRFAAANQVTVEQARTLLRRPNNVDTAVVEAAERLGLTPWHAHALLHVENTASNADNDALTALLIQTVPDAAPDRIPELIDDYSSFQEHLVRKALPELELRDYQYVWWAQWVSPRAAPDDVLAAGRSTPAATGVRRVWGSWAEAVRQAGPGDGSSRLAVFRARTRVCCLGPGREELLLAYGRALAYSGVDLLPGDPLEAIVQDLRPQDAATREATARRLLRLDPSDPLGAAEWSRLDRSMDQARRWLSELTDPDQLLLWQNRTGNHSYNALINTLADLAVCAAAAGRDLDNPTQLGAFYLEMLPSVTTMGQTTFFVNNMVFDPETAKRHDRLTQELLKEASHRGRANTVTDPKGVLWSYSSRSKGNCVNVAVVWLE